MKKIILTTIMSLPLLAQSTNFIEIGIGSQKGTDNFHVESSQNNTSYNTADSFTNTIPYIQFEYSYKNFITKTMQDNLLFAFKNRTLTTGLFTSISNSKESAWSNPYTLNANKEKTKVSKSGAYLEYNIVQKTNYGSKVSYTYTKYDFKDDTTTSSLQRDANDHTIKIDNRYKSNILYNLSYNIHDAKGEQSSSKNYDIGAGYIYNVNKQFNLVVLANIGKTSYDTKNTILNKKIESTNTQFTVVSTWQNPFTLQNKYIKVIYKNSNEDANHDFYDKKQQLAVVSMGFKF